MSNRLFIKIQIRLENCIYCGSNNSKELFNLQDIFEDKFQLRECIKCETAFLNPRPTLGQLNKAYSDDYYGEGETKFNPFVEKVIDFFRQRNAKRMAKLFGKKGSVLDIGCGNGNFLYNLGKQGEFELHGLELPGRSADRASKINQIKLTLGELNVDSFEMNSFDAITLIHVFEHLPNPKEVLEIINKILKPNGVLVIEFPNIDSWQSNCFKNHWFHIDPPRHLNFFKPTKFIEELKQFGFICENESYLSPQFSPYGVQQSLLNKLGLKRDLLYEHLKGNQDYIKGVSKFNLFCQQVFHWVSFPIFVFTDVIASLFKKGGTIRFVFRKTT